MPKTRKSKQRKSVSKRTFKKSNVPPKRKNIIKGGNGNVSFPATFSNEIASVSPQSYLPYNNFSEDPGYSVVNSRNTGPFLTGVASGGKKTRSKQNLKTTKKNRKNNKRLSGGSTGLHTGISNVLNTATSSVGIVPSPAINETSGISGIMSGFSETGSVYNSSPQNIAPLA